MGFVRHAGGTTTLRTVLTGQVYDYPRCMNDSETADLWVALLTYLSIFLVLWAIFIIKCYIACTKRTLRTVHVQSPTTYTYYNLHPRFSPLREGNSGVWKEGVLLGPYDV